MWFKNQDEFLFWVNPAFTLAEELDLWFDVPVPEPVRQRLQVAYRAGDRSPEKHLSVSWLPRHFTGFDLQEPPAEVPDLREHLACGHECGFRGERDDPQQRLGQQTGLGGLWFGLGE